MLPNSSSGCRHIRALCAHHPCHAMPCQVNGVGKQKCRTSEMLFSVPQVISYISSFITLQENDLILTGWQLKSAAAAFSRHEFLCVGTPAGVGPVVDGDVITAVV